MGEVFPLEGSSDLYRLVSGFQCSKLVHLKAGESFEQTMSFYLRLGEGTR